MLLTLQINGLANDEQLQALPAAMPNAPFSLQQIPAGPLFEDARYLYGGSVWSTAFLRLTTEKCWCVQMAPQSGNPAVMAMKSHARPAAGCLSSRQLICTT